MNIEKSAQEDIETILDLYDKAIAYQKSIHAVVVWSQFERSLIEQEIRENRQWKIVENGETACIWAIAYNDVKIWGEKDNTFSIYIHRIATNPKFRGNNYVRQIVAWAKDFAKQHNKKCIRMDTVGNNKKLIEYYQSNGFNFLGMVSLKDANGLPEHYNTKDKVALFEIEI